MGKQVSFIYVCFMKKLLFPLFISFPSKCFCQYLYTYNLCGSCKPICKPEKYE
ncbi:hypothetical protein HMPREF2532_02104 [Bacteroides ovatus]|nr:hypothetical protein HMPREF2532_02104 [Bacteroides ovatus]